MIKKNIFLILLTFVLSLSWLFGQNNLKVEIEGDEVIFRSSSVFGIRGNSKVVLKPKDISTFEYLGGPFSKDRFNVYYKKYILTDTNIPTFRCLDQTDMFQELNLIPGFKSAIGMDTFKIFIMPTSGYYYDSLSAEKTFDRKDFKIIQVLDSLQGVFLIRYKSGVYELSGDMYSRPEIRRLPFNENDYVILGNRFFKSGSEYYYGMLPVYPANPNTFKTFGNSKYYYDGKNVLYKNEYDEEITEADIKTFEIHPIVDCIARDKNYYYFKGMKYESVLEIPLKDFFNGTLTTKQLLYYKKDYGR